MIDEDILLHAIDNTEDVLLHRAWSEEAKQRVREARRAGRKVSELFGSLYSQAGRYVGNASRRAANASVKVSSNVVKTVRDAAGNSKQVRIIKRNVNGAVKKSQHALKRGASNIDSKYNISLNNKGTRAAYTKDRKGMARATKGRGPTYKDLQKNTRGGTRRDKSVAARISQAITGQSKSKYGVKQFRKNVDQANKYYDKRRRLARRTLAGARKVTV